MLGKLWKYDCKATWLYIVLSYVVLVGYTIILKLAEIEIRFPREAEGFPWLMRILLYVGFIIVAIGVQLFTYVQVIRRFYKNLFSEEGYLTNTLPVRPAELLISKILIGAFWIAVTSLVLVFCIGVLGTALPYELRGLLSGLFQQLMQEIPLPTFVLTGVTLVLAPFHSILTFYACICAGQLFPKMRILAAVLIYMAYAVAESTVAALISALLIPVTDIYGTEQMLFGIVFSLVIITGSYYACHWCLSRHLNLE